MQALHFAGEKDQRRLQVGQILSVDQPQRHRRLKIAEVDDLELFRQQSGAAADSIRLKTLLIFY
jgi:hypothetical protein